MQRKELLFQQYSNRGGRGGVDVVEWDPMDIIKKCSQLETYLLKPKSDIQADRSDENLEAYNIFLNFVPRY
ncbi:hypothetical protein RCL_jg1039.t1 [Rhizophagus clarus]|uniref:Uncharacterized protein n=1 Tax=Rhizophagus clarus TaxID=94130 RepID=A0A8H3R2M7_9GLOM|nr:hypothetical protein RCL_jg1039.t1 [Rhizophagus clarus]